MRGAMMTAMTTPTMMASAATATRLSRNSDQKARSASAFTLPLLLGSSRKPPTGPAFGRPDDRLRGYPGPMAPARGCGSRPSAPLRPGRLASAVGKHAPEGDSRRPPAQARIEQRVDEVDREVDGHEQ